MQEFITIEKEPQLKDSQNFAFLKEQGLKHIEALASDLWTDYNSHDPGVTLMEVLAYAITDLGYRTGYDVKDLITASDEALNNHKETFHKATAILPCNQVTALDLREILIDIEGIRNAWIKVAESFENSYYVNYEQSELSITDPSANTQEEVIKLNGLYHIVVEFDRLVIPIEEDEAAREEKERIVLQKAQDRLMEYRNFCEDYFVGMRRYPASNTPVTNIVAKPQAFEKVVLWADVEVKPNADMEKIHAQIYFDVEQFLIPYVTFYSLQERLKKDKRIDEIYEGPLLKNGFIDEDELADIELFECIHTSDLYQVIMDVPGVKAVKSLKIANYISDNGIDHRPDITIEEGGQFSLNKLLASRGEEWCLELSSDMETCEFYELLLETLNTDLSDPINKTVRFYTGENSVPVTINQSRSLDQLNVLRQNDRKRRERLGTTSFELEVPEGTNREVETYYPIQNELPQTYGTGLAGLAEDVSDERKGQAKQLKAYALFFEQLLTNYLAQLNNVRHLFSWDDTIDKTYYTQLLENIKNRGDLYLEEYDSLPLSPGGTLDTARLESLIQEDAEDADLFFDRRSRFLNHLIARFNEQFVEYSLILHAMGLEERLIGDQTKFLSDYDLISKNRGKGFDFTLRRTIDGGLGTLSEPDVWDTDNVTGYQHRISRFLGFSDQTRRFLYSGHDMRLETIDSGGTPKYRYVLTISDETGTVIYGTEKNTDIEAFDQFEELIENEGKDNINNLPDNPGASQYIFEIENADSNVILGVSAVYETALERDNVITEVDTYFEDVSAFLTEIEYDSINDKYRFRIEITSYDPSFFINGDWLASSAEAETALQEFFTELNSDTLGFSLPPIGSITNNEFYFQVTNGLGQIIGTSDSDVFSGSRDASEEGMYIAEEFFEDSIGYMNTEGGVHVVEHILLRPKTNDYSLFEVDVKPYDSIETAENPPVAYPVDYDGLFKVHKYTEQYFLSEEVDLILTSENEFGEDVNIIEPYFYTLSENQESGEDNVGATEVSWTQFLLDLNSQLGTSYILAALGEETAIDAAIWSGLYDDEIGCDFSNYISGTVESEGITFNYYFILNPDTTYGSILLGGLVSSILTLDEVKERALRTLAYFCENTTCKGIANPYEFRATVVLPAWTQRARDFNYREFAEETIRLEAPAHVAVDIKWVNRAQMREFELCYRQWLMDQGEFLYLDRQIQNGDATEDMLVLPDPIEDSSSVVTASTNVSQLYYDMVTSANCLIDKIDGLVDQFQSDYKTVVRNDQYFTNNPSSEGYVIAWVSAAADGSVVNMAEIVGGVLPGFLGFYTGDGFDPDGASPTGTFKAGDFMILDPAGVTAGDWTFSVRTYSDTGQVSCTDVTISIIPDIEAFYRSIPKCYSHLAVGDIVSKIEDPNGVIFSAEILSGSLPNITASADPELKLITDHTDLADWTTLHGLDPANYQPGDIVVDSVLDYSVNDSLAVPATNNEVVNLVVKVTDITGGITVFTASENPYNDGAPPGIVPIKVYGNALLHKIPNPCIPVHVNTFDLENPVYDTPSDILATFFDGHENEGVFLDSAVILPDTDSGISVRIVDGRAEIYVQDFAMFETYIENQSADEEGKVVFPIDLLTVIDTCGFEDTWSGNLCVYQDQEATAEEDVTACAGKYENNPTIITISDSDDGLHSYSLDPAIDSDLADIGIGHQLSGQDLTFTVDNPNLFLAAIQAATLFNGTETVNGVEVNVYNFTVDTTDFFGGTTTVSTKVYAPVNAPLEIDKAFPDGTSYLAYINNVQYYDPNTKYVPYMPAQGNTVVTFSDANGIDSITVSCKDCNNNPFPIKQFPWEVAPINVLIQEISEPVFGVVFESQQEQTEKSQAQEPVSAAKGKKAKKGKANVSERAWKYQTKSKYSQEQYVRPYVNQVGMQYVPNDPNPTKDCLAQWGLALDETQNRIYVQNSRRFATHGVGTLRFSVKVVDGCGIETCEEVTLVIGNDKEAYYVDVKNNTYISTLNNGDTIGYPEDPDGDIVKADIILYDEIYGTYMSPYKPQDLLPPGTKFNKFTGEIKVDAETTPTTGVAVVQASDNLSNTKTNLEFEAVQNETAKQGYSMFKKKSIPQKQAGEAKATADWQIDATKTESPKYAAEKQVFVKDFIKETPWVHNKGKLETGIWKIHVLTKDTFGGLTVIEYTIKIIKDKIISTVGGQLGFEGYVGVKKGINTNYQKILGVQAEIQIQTNDSIEVKAQTETPSIESVQYINPKTYKG